MTIAPKVSNLRIDRKGIERLKNLIQIVKALHFLPLICNTDYCLESGLKTTIDSTVPSRLLTKSRHQFTHSLKASNRNADR